VDIDAPLHWLYDTELAVAMRESDVWFPTVEALHVLALTLVIGSIAVVDLRLVGVASRGRPVARLLREVLPVTWSAFAAAVVTGGLLFASNAVAYAHNSCFQWKLVLLALIGVNTSVFHFFVERRIAGLDATSALPLQARVSGVLSILLWIGVTAFGRWIGFTINAI
jgi:hypothetical protein